MRMIAAAAGSVAVILLGGCSSEGVVDKGDLAKEVSNQLASNVGHEPESLTCPEDLTAKVGASTTCSLSDAGSTYGVKVSVTSVDGSDVKFDIKVDDEPS
ncbi:MAG: DUF4333 domain-containing protein [Mycobacterium sp.]